MLNERSIEYLAYVSFVLVFISIVLFVYGLVLRNHLVMIFSFLLGTISSFNFGVFYSVLLHKERGI